MHALSVDLALTVSFIDFATSKDSPTIRQQSIRRAGTLVRSPLDLGRKDKDGSGKYTGSEVSVSLLSFAVHQLTILCQAFGRALEQITQHVLREQDFISDFLHINALDASITFADYMILETYFRRGATSYLASQQNKLKDIRSAMDLVFGFLDGELKDWIDGILAKDSMCVLLASLRRRMLMRCAGKSLASWRRLIVRSCAPRRSGTISCFGCFRSSTRRRSKGSRQLAWVLLPCEDGERPLMSIWFRRRTRSRVSSRRS